MGVKILQGDCRDVLKTLPDQSVNCCVTSPPYWGLRDYGCDGQIGLESTPDAYVAELVAVFREVKRVLRNDGTLWLNLGDSYAYNVTISEKFYRNSSKQKTNNGALLKDKVCKVPLGLKPKDLIGTPWRVAFALQADGWYLRQDIIWHKPNPMPESVTDRCTKAHKYIFLLSKSQKYYCDMDAIKEPVENMGKPRKFRDAGDKAADTKRNDNGRVYIPKEDRNKRSVWTVNTKPYKEAHFAVFPPDLIRPCILAGCPVGGTVLDPFGGSGTTGEVSEEEGRNSILIELNPEYVELEKKRTAQMGLFCGGANV